MDWYPGGLDDDLRPHISECLAKSEPFALVTIAAATGGPRPAGAQMLVTSATRFGFLSGGCVEDDVTLHARAVLAEGTPRWLTYGAGSPFIDMRLACGGRIDLLVERIRPGDAAAIAIVEAWHRRRAIGYFSDGIRRWCVDADRIDDVGGEAKPLARYQPAQRLIIVGRDAFALALAEQGLLLRWRVTLIDPSGRPERPPVFGARDLDYMRCNVAEALERLSPDGFTAIAIMTHDEDADHKALLTALAAAPGYIGILGSRRRSAKRADRLKAAGIEARAIASLRAPIGLAIGAASPREVALAVAAQIVATRRAAGWRA